jgi:uncharacterized protein
MSERTQRAIELFLDRRVPELESLVLSWFGGEPLLAKDVVLRLAKHAFGLSERYGVAFQGNMTTNAYVLNRELAAQLIAYNQNFFQITLDGWEEAHDLLRRRADGRGTFSKIWENLLGMKSLDRNFEVCIRVHVRRDNLANLPILMSKLSESFGGDSRFRLDFQHLRDMGGEGGKTIVDPIGIQELAAIERSLRSVFKTVKNDESEVIEQTVSESQPTLLARTAGESAGSRRLGENRTSEPYICYAAKPNSILIRSNGRIGKCTVALSDERNDLGCLVEDGTLEIDNAKLQPWIRGLGTLDHEVTGCPMTNMGEQPTPTTLINVQLKSDRPELRVQLV